MRHFLAWFVALIFLAQGATAQQSRGDSLRQVLNDVEQADSTRFEAGYGYLMFQFRTDLEAARGTGAQLLGLATQMQDRTREATAHRLIGNTYAVQSRYEQALEAFFKSHKILQELEDEKGLATTAREWQGEIEETCLSKGSELYRKKAKKRAAEWFASKS